MLKEVIRKSGHKRLGKFFGKYGNLMLVHGVQKVYSRRLITLFIGTSQIHIGLIYGK